MLRLPPPEIDVTREVVSSGLGGALLKIEHYKRPLDDVYFRMCNTYQQVLLCMHPTEESSKQTPLLGYSLDLPGRRIGNMTLLRKEAAPLRAAYRSLPPVNVVWRIAWLLKRQFEQQEVHADFGDKLTLRDLHWMEEQAHMAVERAHRKDEEAGVAWPIHTAPIEADIVTDTVIQPCLTKLGIGGEEAEEWRIKLLKRFGYFPAGR